MLSLYVLNIEYIRTEYSVQCSRILKLNYNSNSSCLCFQILLLLQRDRNNVVLQTTFLSWQDGVDLTQTRSKSALAIKGRYNSTDIKLKTVIAAISHKRAIAAI